MKRRHKEWGYRQPKTGQEKRANQDGWCRPKRYPHRLVDFWNDIQVYPRKSWKDDRLTQYRVGKRGQHHSIRLEDEWRALHNLEEYCSDHDIPHFTEEIKRSYLVPEYKYVKTGKIKRIVFNPRSYWDIEQKIRVKTGRMIPCKYVDYEIFHWWSNKDIGVEYII